LTTVRGKKAWIHADRNGYFYAIDRANGKFIYGKPIAVVNWSTLDANGRPVVDPSKVPTRTKAASNVCPGPNGGKEWNPMAYHPGTGCAYVPVSTMRQVHLGKPSRASLLGVLSIDNQRGSAIPTCSERPT
jgi:glucose dehydrogenase